MNENPRVRQVAERIREIVAEAVELRVKDPRLGFVTITACRLTADFRDATLFFTVYGDESARKDTFDALTASKGTIRTEVGRRLGMKHTPSITFMLDALPETSAHLEDLLSEAHKRDEEVESLRKSARPAGDENPYKKEL
jgi:ribosome-binding factor A